MKFTTSLDRLAKGITIGTSILFAVIIAVQFFSDEHTTAIFVALLLLAIYLFTYFYRPINYNLTKNELIIHRLISNVEINCQNIKRVEPITKDQMKWTIRTFGVGGLFGYYGKFVNSKLGNMTWYATRRDKTVLIETLDGKKLVVTPDEPEEFIQQLRVLTQRIIKLPSFLFLHAAFLH